MIYRQWLPGASVNPPVYIDANVLVAMLVSNHPLAIPCSQMFGELLVNQHPIFISDLGVSESFWAIAGIAYSRLTGQPARMMGKGPYRRNVQAMFRQYTSIIRASSQWLHTLVGVPYPISMVPATPLSSTRVVDQTTFFMDQLRLTPGDAVHLAVAEEYASTFVTCDGDYNVVAAPAAQASNLTVLRVK